MHDLFRASGDIAWAFFCALVFTAVIGLLVDYSWRLLRMRSAYLALVSGAIWLVVIVLIGVFASL